MERLARAAERFAAQAQRRAARRPAALLRSATPTGWTTTRCSWRWASAIDWRDWCDWDARAGRARAGGAGGRGAASMPSASPSGQFCQWGFFRQWLALKAYANERGVRDRRRRADLHRLPERRGVGTAQRCSSWTPTGRPDAWWPACRRTSSAPPASAGATRCTAGAHTPRTATPGGSSACAAPSSWWTSCASTTSAALPATGRSRPASRPPIKGRWLPGPGEALFKAIAKALGPLPIIAEDLGVITPDVDGAAQEVRLPRHAHPAVRLRRRQRQPLPAAQPRAPTPWSTPARTTTTPTPAGGPRRPRRNASARAATSPPTATTSTGT